MHAPLQQSQGSQVSQSSTAWELQRVLRQSLNQNWTHRQPRQPPESHAQHQRQRPEHKPTASDEQQQQKQHADADDTLEPVSPASGVEEGPAQVSQQSQVQPPTAEAVPSNGEPPHKTSEAALLSGEPPCEPREAGPSSGEPLRGPPPSGTSAQVTKVAPLTAKAMPPKRSTRGWQHQVGYRMCLECHEEAYYRKKQCMNPVCKYYAGPDPKI